MKSEGKLRSVQFLCKVHCVRIYAVLRSKIWDGILKAEGTLRAMLWGSILRAEGKLRSVQWFGATR